MELAAVETEFSSVSEGFATAISGLRSGVDGATQFFFRGVLGFALPDLALRGSTIGNQCDHFTVFCALIMVVSGKR